MTNQKFSRKSLALAATIVATSLADARAATVAYWNYDGSTAGTPFSATPVVDVSGNGNTMFGFDPFWGPSYSAFTPNNVGLSQRSDAFHQDGYTAGAPVNSWSPLAWTIEATIRLDNVGGWNTIIGRDGSNAGPESNFYLQNNGINDRFRVNFLTVGGQRYVLDSNFIGLANQWYGIAITSDGTMLNMYADKLDGNGYQNVGSLALNNLNNNALAQNGANWTFGRGWYNGGFVDHISGYLDNVRFSDTALPVGQFIPVPEPSALAFSILGGLATMFVLRRSRKV